MNEPKIAIIIGTRAELIKTFPVMLELQKRGIPYYFIHSGQHNLSDLCTKFGVKTPDIVLTKEPTKSSKFKGNNKFLGILWNLGLLSKIKRQLKKLKSLKYVLYHGDTMTTASASIASSKMFNPNKKYKSVHLEAGLRSWNWKEPFPEELSRRVAGKFSDILFAVSPEARDNLKKYKGSKEVVLVGNTIVDSANIAYNMAKNQGVKPLGKNFALISIHRHENIKSKTRMEKIVKILGNLDFPAFFPLHENTRLKLEEFGLLNKLKENRNIKLIEPMDYVSFIFQIAHCSMIICDGGSLQEESLIFKKPCIILRKATERPEGLNTNFQFLSNLDVEKTVEKIREFSHEDFKIKKFNNPYGEKGLTKRIVDYLK